MQVLLGGEQVWLQEGCKVCSECTLRLRNTCSGVHGSQGKVAESFGEVWRVLETLVGGLRRGYPLETVLERLGGGLRRGYPLETVLERLGGGLRRGYPLETSPTVVASVEKHWWG